MSIKKVLAVLLLLGITNWARAESEPGLVLPEVIVQSSFQGKNETPEVSHRYDLFDPQAIKEPYIPSFRINGYLLPKGFPQNEKIGWMAKSKSLGELAPVFDGDEGAVQYGIVQHKKGDFNSAEKSFREIYEEGGKYAELAGLWLGWISAEQKKWAAATRLARTLRKSKNKDMAGEALYLEAYALAGTKKFKKILELSAEEKLEVKASSSFKFRYIRLVSFVELSRWEEGKVLADELEKNFPHAVLFPKLLEMSGAINFELGKYREGVKKMLLLKKLRPNFRDSEQIAWKMAWSYYLAGEFKEAAAQLVGVTSKKSDERNYLDLVLRLKSKKWKSALKVYRTFSKSGEFRDYAIFQIISHGRNNPEVKDIVAEALDANLSDQELDAYTKWVYGNDRFLAGELVDAESGFLKAVSAFPNNPSYWKIQFNLGLTYLKKYEFAKAIKTLNEIKAETPKSNWPLLRSHLLYAYYQTKQVEKFQVTREAIEMENLPSELQSEIAFMAGGNLLFQGRLEEAGNKFTENWRTFSDFQALEMAAAIFYRMGRFQMVVDISTKQFEKSAVLLRYRVKSLLALGKFNLAVDALQKDGRKERNPTLWLNVWMANRMYDKVVSEARRFLKSKILPENRLAYYLVLGDAYFNQKKYRKSKSQIFRALKLSTDKAQKSLIQYNLILVTYSYGDYTSFEKEASVYLKRDLAPVNRLGITQLLVDYRVNRKEFALAENALENYLKKTAYRAGLIHRRRIELVYLSGNYSRCFQLAEEVNGEEDVFQRRDRIVFLGRCGIPSGNSKKVVANIKKEISGEGNYRREDLRILLAEAYLVNERYNASLLVLDQLDREKLSEDFKLEIGLLYARNYLAVDRLAEAEKLLGDVNFYRKIGRYPTAVDLKSRLLVQKKEIGEAVKLLLRIMYLPKTSPIKKQEAILKASEFYLEMEKIDEARSLMKKADPKVFENKGEMKANFEKIKMKLAE